MADPKSSREGCYISRRAVAMHPRVLDPRGTLHLAEAQGASSRWVNDINQQHESHGVGGTFEVKKKKCLAAHSQNNPVTRM